MYYLEPVCGHPDDIGQSKLSIAKWKEECYVIEVKVKENVVEIAEESIRCNLVSRNDSEEKICYYYTHKGVEEGMMGKWRTENEC